MNYRYLNIILGAILTILTIMVVYAYADAPIIACPQTDGSVVYTNKKIKGCITLKLPKLSVVPDRKAQLDYETPEVVREVPTIAQTSIKPAAPGSVLAETCSLYRDWVRINERTMGGFEYNSVDDTKKRLVLTKIFGSGFTPYGCQ